MVTRRATIGGYFGHGIQPNRSVTGGVEQGHKSRVDDDGALNRIEGLGSGLGDQVIFGISSESPITDQYK